MNYPDSWRNSSQVTNAFGTSRIRRTHDIDHINALYIRVRDDFNISSLPETVCMHYATSSRIVNEHVGADVESHLIYLCVYRMNICLRQQAPPAYRIVQIVNANEESTISDITQIIRNVDEAYARYKYDTPVSNSTM
jgi:hypothetical protein